MAKTVLERYREIVKTMSDSYFYSGMTRDKANRLANIFAVQNIWSIYNEEPK